jgi:hypothetical protein
VQVELVVLEAQVVAATAAQHLQAQRAHQQQVQTTQAAAEVQVLHGTQTVQMLVYLVVLLAVKVL